MERVVPCGLKTNSKGVGGGVLNFEKNHRLLREMQTSLMVVGQGSTVVKFDGCESHSLGVMAIKALKVPNSKGGAVSDKSLWTGVLEKNYHFKVSPGTITFFKVRKREIFFITLFYLFFLLGRNFLDTNL